MLFRALKTFLSFLLCITSSYLFAQKDSTAVRLDSGLTHLHNMHRFNGTVLYADSSGIYRKAFGITDITTNQPLQTSNAFNLGSISKQFFAMCIMILKEEGKLAFDDDIRKYLPELPYEHITIRNLLTHTSGIPEYFLFFLQHQNTVDTLTNAKIIALYARLKLPLDFTTGSQWQYSNTNYIFLSIIVQRVSKQPIDVFLKERITKPLRLKNTYIYNVLLPSPAGRVLGYREVNGKRKMNDLEYTDFYSPDGSSGDGNVYSSMEDLYTWEQALYTEKLVKKETMQEALTPVKLNDGKTYPYGFGWFINKENESYSHTGGWVGFSNIINRDVKNHRTLIVLSSSTEGASLNYASNVFNHKQALIAKNTIITNVSIVDGTGSAAYKGAVRIVGNEISAVGELTPYDGEEVIDGMGKTLAPGFIDTHSHLDLSLAKKPEALAAVNQGITTIVVGQDGNGNKVDSIVAASKKTPAAVNMATYTGHTTLRTAVMGEKNLNRPATQAEIDSMKTLLEQELKKGSLGLSTGLEYEGAFYSNRDEVLQLAKTTAANGGKYISHLRSEDVTQDAALNEITSIGQEAKLPVQISHIKTALKDDWGNASYITGMLQDQRKSGINITADCYPYTYWLSTLKVLFPKKDYTSLQSATYAMEHLINADSSVMVAFVPNPLYMGKTITQIASLRKETSPQTLLYLVAAATTFEKDHPGYTEPVEAVVGTSMSEADVTTFLTWANTNFCTDGADGYHPRSYGSFTRILGKYVREKKLLTLEQAIYKMTGLAAEHVGLQQRGTIAPGQYADLVLLDPQTVTDNATIQNPTALSTGIIKVWVNGLSVYHNQQATGMFPGRFIKRQ